MRELHSLPVPMHRYADGHTRYIPTPYASADDRYAFCQLEAIIENTLRDSVSCGGPILATPTAVAQIISGEIKSWIEHNTQQ